MAGRTGPKTKLTLAIATEICNRIASDESLASICKEERMPSTVTVWNWIRKYPEFREAYNQARLQQGHTIADGLSDIRRELWVGKIEPSRANSLFTIIKWEAGVLNPASYAARDNLSQETQGTVEHDLGKLSKEELDTLAHILAKAQPDDEGQAGASAPRPD